jgi:hypothetical protein
MEDDQFYDEEYEEGEVQEEQEEDAKSKSKKPTTNQRSNFVNENEDIWDDAVSSV